MTPAAVVAQQPVAARPIHEIIIHCTASPEGREVSVATIREWHLERRFSDIGYHYVVHLDGSVEPGRPEQLVGAHVSGHNTGTLGVVYVGGVAADGETPKDTRTPAQRTALVALVDALITKYPAVVKVTGHNQYAAKACPSFDVRTDFLGTMAPRRRSPAKPSAEPVPVSVVGDPAPAASTASRSGIGALLAALFRLFTRKS